MKKYSRFSVYGFIFLALSFLLLFINRNTENLSMSPTYPDIFGYALLPVISIAFAVTSLRKSNSRFINILLIILSLLPILLFILIALLGHCGFYTGKCR